MSETTKAAELSAKYPNAPLGLLFAVQDLERKLENQRSHIQAFAQCLDGLLTPRQQAAIPGSGIDTARDAKQIRAIVTALIAQLDHQQEVIHDYAEQALEDGHD